MGHLLGGPFDLGRGGPGGWRILVEPELHLGPEHEPDIVVPDLAAWRLDRMPARPAGAYVTTPPDWVCEVLSPSTAPVDRADKMPIYAREGVVHAWLIEPIGRVLEHYQREGSRWMLAAVHRGTGAVRVAPFDEVELDLHLLFES